jgi:hypothetical protein
MNSFNDKDIIFKLVKILHNSDVLKIKTQLKTQVLFN